MYSRVVQETAFSPVPDNVKSNLARRGATSHCHVLLRDESLRA